MQIGNILDNTTELYMIKYTFGEIFSSGGATLPKNPSDLTVTPLNQNFSVENTYIGSKNTFDTYPIMQAGFVNIKI